MQEELSASGLKHVQMFVQMKDKLRMSTMAKWLQGKAHIEQRHGPQQDAWDYCTPEGTKKSGAKGGINPYTFGELKIDKPGKRNDYHGFVKMARDGEREEDIMMAYPMLYCRHAPLIGKIRARGLKQSRTAERLEKGVEVHIHWGPTGTGKTRAVHEMYDEEDLWCNIPGTSKWFDGYHGQAIALFDDFNSGIAITDMLRICDRYALLLQVKGAVVDWLPTKIYITSNINPNDWWMDASEEHKAAWKRRVTKCTCFKPVMAVGGPAAIERTQERIYTASVNAGTGSYARGYQILSIPSSDDEEEEEAYTGIGNGGIMEHGDTECSEMWSAGVRAFGSE